MGTRGAEEGKEVVVSGAVPRPDVQFGTVQVGKLARPSAQHQPTVRAVRGPAAELREQASQVRRGAAKEKEKVPDDLVRSGCSKCSADLRFRSDACPSLVGQSCKKCAACGECTFAHSMSELRCARDRPRTPVRVCACPPALRRDDPPDPPARPHLRVHAGMHACMHADGAGVVRATIVGTRSRPRS